MPNRIYGPTILPHLEPACGIGESHGVRGRLRTTVGLNAFVCVVDVETDGVPFTIPIMLESERVHWEPRTQGGASVTPPAARRGRRQAVPASRERVRRLELA